MTDIEFQAWPKIARLNRDIVVTEKLDGTNAAIIIEPLFNHILMPGPLLNHGTDADKAAWHLENTEVFAAPVVDGQTYLVAAQSRTRMIWPGQDNYGFALWVQKHAEVLVKALGPGRHFGEWWGQGIQRKYGADAKQFSLFNTHRYAGIYTYFEDDGTTLDHVPVLYQGPFDQSAIHNALDTLRFNGSFAAVGFERPEGVIVYHEAARTMFKVTLEGDEAPKSVSGL